MRKLLTTFTRVVTSTAMAMSVLAVSAGTAHAGPQGVFKTEVKLMQPKVVKVGSNQFEVLVKGTDGKPLSGADVSLMFVMPAMPAMNMAETRNEVNLTPSGPGMYTGSGNVTMAGNWAVTAAVKRGGKQLAQKKFKLVVE